MEYPKHFIRATEAFNTFENHVPAPWFRKEFQVSQACSAKVVITACGFYELYLNGVRYTKGAMAPYISNTDHILYYDAYDLPLNAGSNVLAVLLGNGLQNNPGGYIWDFDQLPYRGAPQFALSLSWTDADGSAHSMESDESFRTAPSGITFDDYRFGEYYDARLENPDLFHVGFDDSSWKFAIPAPMPRGEARICEAEPIVVTQELKPVSITPEGDGFRYDFGVNAAGVCRLNITGKPGQQIDLVHGEWVKPDNTLDLEKIWFHRDEGLWQRDLPLLHRDIYICRGNEPETYTPKFTYHGFRYVLVTGITAEQATEDLLTYVVMNSDLKVRGDFSCSSETVNKLQELTRRSDLANFYYFPTDCPQREKNGWTADASLSAEHMLLNLSVETSFREWQRNICKSQHDNGQIPGIVPTGSWGYSLGPAWDNILVYLPYFVYKYRGETDMIRSSANSFLRYLHFLTEQNTPEGLIDFGLGDWCHADRGSSGHRAPRFFTGTVMAMDIAEKMAFLFDVVGMVPQREFATAIAKQYRQTIREQLIDLNTMTAIGNCQTSQAMAIFYNIFEPGEKPAAFAKLLEFVHQEKDLLDVGVLGARVLFHVLAQFGYAELALKMIEGPEYPSYGYWLAWDATSLWESFSPNGMTSSRNHHFWGDISSWFIQYLAGIRLNPSCKDVNRLDIAPCFVDSLDHAEGWHIAPAGKISSSWVREGDQIRLTLEIPEGMSGNIKLESGFTFTDGYRTKPLASGSYLIAKI